MDESIRERRTLARELRQAIADEDLTVHYQPLAKASDGEVCGFEALVRWNHPVRGMVPPLEFIPVAEENGLIAQLGEWVLRRACADAVDLGAAAAHRGQPVAAAAEPAQPADPGARGPDRDRPVAASGWSWRSPKAPCSRTISARSTTCAG